MLIVFKSRAAANVLMFSEHAQTIMQVIGRSYPEGLPQRGVITHDQLPDAIQALERAMATDKEKAQETVVEDDEPVHPVAEPVSFRQRAWPLLTMLKASSETQADVMWEPAPKW